MINFNFFQSFFLPFSIAFSFSFSNVPKKEGMKGYANVYYYHGDTASQSLILNPIDTMGNCNQLTYYFSNLIANYPRNSFGSCAFQSAAMELAYYDTYYNDSIVNDNFINKTYMNCTADYYTASSPGCQNENFSSIEMNDFYEYISNHYNDTLQLNLLKIGKDKNYINDNSLLFSPNFGLSLYQQYDILRTYLSNNSLSSLFDLSYCEYQESVFSFNSENNGYSSESREISSSVYSEISNYISQGYPVLVGIYYLNPSNNYRQAGHSMVAFDNYHGSLYCHSGYEDDLCVSLGGEYVYCGYVAMIPTSNRNHVCSSNYVLNNVGICPCSLPLHTHDYVNYQIYTSLKHKKICYCGSAAIIEFHNFEELSNGRSYCTECGYLSNGGSIIVNGVNNNEEI